MTCLKAVGRTGRPNHHRSNANAFVNWLLSKDILSENPFKQVARLPETEDRRRVRRAATTAEMERLLQAAPLSRQVVYLALLLTGLRRGEMRQMTWGLVNFDESTVFVPAAISKNGRDATLPMHPHLLQLLLSIRPANAKPGCRWFRSIPQPKTFYKDLAQAGVEKVDARGRVLDIHGFRSTLGTNLARQNVPMPVVQQILRHADIATTAKYYTHLDIADLRDGVTKLPVTWKAA